MTHLGPVNDRLHGVAELHGGVDQLAEGLHSPENMGEYSSKKSLLLFCKFLIY